MLALLLAASISTNFEGGSLGQVEVLSPTHLRCSVKGEVDQDHRNREVQYVASHDERFEIFEHN